MLHDERILKNKFAYFLAVIFVLCWIIFFAYNFFCIFLEGLGFKKEYSLIKAPIYVLYFLILPLLIMTFVSIFREQRRMFFYLNISLFLILLFHLLFFLMNYPQSKNQLVYGISFIVMNIVFVILPVVIINYFKHYPIKNEIEDIGQN